VFVEAKNTENTFRDMRDNLLKEINDWQIGEPPLEGGEDIAPARIAWADPNADKAM